MSSGRLVRLGSIALVAGAILLGFGVAGRIFPSAMGLAGYYGGFVVLFVSLVAFLKAGWQGDGLAWLIATLPAAILTWAMYELVRQTPPYPPVGVLGEMTAPTLSALVAVAIVVVGRRRLRTRRVSMAG